MEKDEMMGMCFMLCCVVLCYHVMATHFKETQHEWLNRKVYDSMMLSTNFGSYMKKPLYVF